MYSEDCSLIPSQIPGAYLYSPLSFPLDAAAAFDVLGRQACARGGGQRDDVSARRVVEANLGAGRGSEGPGTWAVSLERRGEGRVEYLLGWCATPRSLPAVPF